MYKVRQAVRKHRKLLSVCAMVLAIALMFWAVNSPAIVGVSAAKRVLPIYCVQRDDRVVSLSFDAAWGNEDTQMLIDILNKYNVHATFFVVGEWVDKYPESVKVLADAGNEVMNHSSTHPHMAQLSAEQLQTEGSLHVRRVQLHCREHHQRSGHACHPVGCGFPRLEGAEQRRDHIARAHARAAGQHRAVPQRGRAHTGGAGRHH